MKVGAAISTKNEVYFYIIGQGHTNTIRLVAHAPTKSLKENTMPIELRVEGRIQTSPFSCWWACMAMVLNYYGNHYNYPWDYRRYFARPWQTIPSHMPRMRYPDIDEYFETPAEARRRMIYEEPYEWYYFGVPPSQRSLSLLSDITGFRGLDVRLAFGHWTLADVELLLRTCGPLLLFGTYEGGRRHVILITGAISNPAIGEDQIVYIDPAIGIPQQRNLLDFNTWVQTFTSEWTFSGLNPVYLPTSNPVKETISLM